MKSNRIISVLLVAAVAVTLTACGGKEETEE